MPQIAYCTDEKDYYTHSEYCTIDPVESAKQGHDVYVLPANGYIDAPVIADGCVVRRVNGAWVNVENHVGEKGYVNGVPTEIKEYGPLPEGWSETPPPPTIKDQLAAIESTYESKFSALRGALQSALLADGVNMEGTLTALRAEWANLANAKSAEMAALLEA